MLEEHHQEVESWVKSGEVQGLSFPCPLNACGTARPKARPLLRACSSAWRSELLPSAQPKWLRMAKEILPRKKAQLCQLHCHVLTSTQAWESNTRVLPPLTAPPFLSTGPSTVPRPTIPTPRGRQVRDCPCCLQHPTTTNYWNLTLWCLWCIISFFPPPNPNSYMSEMWHYQPIPKWVSVGAMVLCDSPFLPHHFCQRCHCTSQGNTHESDRSKVPTQQWNSSPQMVPGPCCDSLHFQNRFGSLGKRLFWSTKWQGGEKSAKLSQITQHGEQTTICKLTWIKF